jgi:hypothetical protein
LFHVDHHYTTPGNGGGSHLDRPLFNTMKEAVKATGATTTITFVAPAFCADAIMEAADAGIRLICSITDGIPAQDMMRVKRYLRRYKAEARMRLIGPNCAGMISPGKAMMGIMPAHIYLPGRVGIVGRSGTLGYEAASQMKVLGIGVSTSVGIGGDPVNGSSFRDILELFEKDPQTDAVTLELGRFLNPQWAELLHTVAEFDSGGRCRLAVHLDDDVEIRPDRFADAREVLDSLADGHTEVDRVVLEREETALDARPADVLLLHPERDLLLDALEPALFGVALTMQVTLVTVDAHFVARLASEETPDRHADRLS